MIKKHFVEALGADVVLARRKGTRNLRLSIKSDGIVRLSVPYGVSERQAVAFLLTKADWIKKHVKPRIELEDGDHIGKSHRLVLVTDAVPQVKTRLKPNQAIVQIPANVSTNDPKVQDAAKRVATRALLKEAKALLPQRLQTLAEKHGVPYNSVSVKKLKSRWGSCDNRKNIVLNIYLMQLDWHLIDYVLVHELAHTYHPHHQPAFWEFLGSMLPDWKSRRAELRKKPTDIFATKF